VQNKRILVTGGTSGIGQAIAISVAQAGANVAFCGLTDEGAEKTLRAIQQAGQKAFFRALDVSNLQETRQFVQDAISSLGGLDGLVNNAGANLFHGVLGATQEDIQRCFAVDFYPAWAICQEAHAALKAAGGGVVVNIASIHAERTNPGAFPYNAAKAALVALTKSLALEWGKDNIRAVAIAPALIVTPLADAYYNTFADSMTERKRLENHYPLGHVGRPEDIASLVVYLLSGVNSFLSGTPFLSMVVSVPRWNLLIANASWQAERTSHTASQTKQRMVIWKRESVWT
jgi:NAD(P)-dependent dehydrogenase (short-subunit alcohol dehydrogenase family)